jgi:hypothetical protein
MNAYFEALGKKIVEDAGCWRLLLKDCGYRSSSQQVR